MALFGAVPVIKYHAYTMPTLCVFGTRIALLALPCLAPLDSWVPRGMRQWYVNTPGCYSVI